MGNLFNREYPDRLDECMRTSWFVRDGYRLPDFVKGNKDTLSDCSKPIFVTVDNNSIYTIVQNRKLMEMLHSKTISNSTDLNLHSYSNQVPYSEKSNVNQTNH